MKKQLAALGLSAGLVFGGTGLALSNAGAQDSTSTTATASADQSDGAASQSTDANRPDPSQHFSEAIAPLVSDGTITQAQADAVVRAISDAGPPQGGQGGPGGPGGRDGQRGGPGTEAAATALGISADDLRTELQSGKSIADVASEKSVDVQTVIDAMIADLKTHLDEEVASGTHTQAEADQRLADATEHITAMVNGEKPAGGPGQDGQAPPADAPADGSTTTTAN